MLFNSLEFAIFLPIVFLLYWFVLNSNLKWQNLFIVCVSYIFYGWWDWRFLLLIGFTSVCSFVAGQLIVRFRTEDLESKSKIRFSPSWYVSAINILINVLLLAGFKYYNFFVDSFIEAFRLFGKEFDIHTMQVILPVGISFYTFQALSYSIDVYRRKLQPATNLISFLAYVSFFPQLVAGPIERAINLLPQFYSKRTFDSEKAVDGMRQILWGLFKKMVVADNCAIYANQVFDGAGYQPGSTLLLGALFFAFQIYGDFSGYSDIAIGTARLFGFSLMRNFNYPYFSRDIAEFWRRWHISLSTWFRDYVYIPMGGSRSNLLFTIRNTLTVFVVSGFWHGANWTFLAWGGYHGLLFLPLLLLKKNRRFTDVVAENRFLPSGKEFFQMLSTFFLVLLGWIFFRSKNINAAVQYLNAMFTGSLFEIPDLFYLSTKCMLFILFMLTIEWIQRFESHGLVLQKIKSRVWRWSIYLFLLMAIFLFGGGEETFIYFQF